MNQEYFTWDMIDRTMPDLKNEIDTALYRASMVRATLDKDLQPIQKVAQKCKVRFYASAEDLTEQFANRLLKEAAGKYGVDLELTMAGREQYGPWRYKQFQLEHTWYMVGPYDKEIRKFPVYVLNGTDAREITRVSGPRNRPYLMSTDEVLKQIKEARG